VKRVGSALDKECIVGRHKSIGARETLHIFTRLLIVDHSVPFGHSGLGLMSLHSHWNVPLGPALCSTKISGFQPLNDIESINISEIYWKKKKYRHLNAQSIFLRPLYNQLPGDCYRALKAVIALTVLAKDLFLF
jgi:hypothetical protein